MFIKSLFKNFNPIMSEKNKKNETQNKKPKTSLKTIQQNKKTTDKKTLSSSQTIKPNSKPSSPATDEKTDSKKNNTKTIEPKKETNSEKSNINAKKQTNEKKPKREETIKPPKDSNKTEDKQKKAKNNKNGTKKPKEEIVKPNLKKTDMKTLSPPKDFQLSDQKIKKLEKNGYRNLKPIGQGSYGKVFKAKSNKYHNEVAIKVMDLNRLSYLFKTKFLVVEMEVMKTLKDHKNVVKFHEIIEAKNDNLLYILMELCPNGDLFDYIIKRHYIPERQACLWFRQLISGVEHIHNSGFAHRDLKCENLLLDNNYNIKIIDFGFCCKIRYQKMTIKTEDKIIERSVEIPSDTYCGSVIYASPELLKGFPYFPTMTDIWSCGVIVYVMLFGSYPNDGIELDQFIQMEIHSIKAPESPKVSEECKELIENILIDETDRYSIEKLKDSLWFKQEWQPIDDKLSLKEYFETLNLERQPTEEFEVVDEPKQDQFIDSPFSQLKRTPS